MKKRILSLLMAVALVLSFSPAALAAPSDSQVTSATLGGVAIDLGTPVTNPSDAADWATTAPTAGSVTLTTAQATNAALAVTSALTPPDVYALKVAKDDTATFAFDSDSLIAPAAATYADGDYVLFAVTDGTDTYLYAIKVNVAADAGTSATVGGSGDTAYIDLEIYDVTLPTSASLDFALDPQGLLAIEDGQTVDLDDLQGGRIVPLSGAAKAINNSAVDVTLSVAMTGTGDATFLPYDNDDATTLAGIDADANNNVLLYAVPSSVNMVDTDTAYTAASKGYVITDSASTLKFVLPKAEYEVKNNNGTYVATPKTGTGHGTAIQLGGYVNSTADWAAFTGASPAKDVGVSVVFSYAKATSGESGTTPVTGIPGLITTTSALSLVAPATVDEVTVTPGTASVAKGATHDFTATVTGTNNPDQTVTWSVNGTSTNTKFTGNTLTVGSDETKTTLTVTATSTVDNTKSGTATVTVSAPTLGFTDAGGTATSSKVYTTTGAADLVVGFYFGGNTVTSIKKGISTIATSNYTVNANDITLKSSYLSTLATGTNTLTITMNSVTYTLNITKQ